MCIVDGCHAVQEVSVGLSLRSGSHAQRLVFPSVQAPCSQQAWAAGHAQRYAPSMNRVRLVRALGEGTRACMRCTLS